MTLLSAFALGILFAIGLGLGGMTQPARIIGFLDVAGRWDPSLLLVLGGAVAVSMTLFPAILARPGPLLATRFVLPEQRRIDAPLLIGASLFGVGWGLSGYCPGPAIVSLVTATPAVLIFIATMLVGLGVGTRMVQGGVRTSRP